MKPAILALFVSLAVAAPLTAQPRRVPPPSRAVIPAISLRPFVMASLQNVAAVETFTAAFGGQLQPFFGGGLQVAFRNGWFVDATASRFSKTGQRVFRANDQNFVLGIPLTVTEIPFEATVGYRHQAPRSRLVPYAGGGIGSYSYKESSPGDDSSDAVSTRSVGYLAMGGIEFRVSRSMGMSGDLQYTRVTGILGAGGFSKLVNESDLGGVAVRFRVIVGR